jgi:hypothetical protein
MAISITLDFDDTWAGRLAPMVVDRIENAQYNPVIVALIDSLPDVDSVDDLTTKQKAKLWILFGLLCQLQRWEGQEAGRAAQQTVIDDIAINFPLEAGEA